jgi:hypothetical protein
MAWYFFINNANGDLVSEGSTVPEGIDTDVYEVRDVVTRPDWTVKSWNPTLKQLFDRPLPILIDRLDDIEARFLADPDFSAVWAALNATRKAQLRTGIMRVLASFIGARRFRQEDERVEVD